MAPETMRAGSARPPPSIFTAAATSADVARESAAPVSTAADRPISLRTATSRSQPFGVVLATARIERASPAPWMRAFFRPDASAAPAPSTAVISTRAMRRPCCASRARYSAVSNRPESPEAERLKPVPTRAASSSTTSWPAALSAVAVSRPVSPPPTTTTSAAVCAGAVGKVRDFAVAGAAQGDTP